MKILLDKKQEHTKVTHTCSSFSVKTDNKSIVKKIDVYMMNSVYCRLFNKYKDIGLVSQMRILYEKDADNFIKMLSVTDGVTKVIEHDIEKACVLIEIDIEHVRCYFELTGMLNNEWKNIQNYKAFDYYSPYYGPQKGAYVCMSPLTNNRNTVINTSLGFGLHLLSYLKDIGYKTIEKDFNTILEKENEVGILEMIKKANSRDVSNARFIDITGHAAVFLSQGNRGNDVVINANKYSYIKLRTEHMNNWLIELTKILGHEIMFKLTEATFVHKNLDGFGNVAKEMILNIVPPKVDNIKMSYNLNYFGRDFTEFYPYLYQSIKGYLMSIRGYHWSQEHIMDRGIEPRFNEEKQRPDFYIVKVYGGKIIQDEIRQNIAIVSKLIQPFWHSYSKTDNETLSKYVERIGDNIVETESYMGKMENISDIINFAEKYERQCQCQHCVEKSIGKYQNNVNIESDL